MTVRYLEDLAVGQTFGSGRLRIEKQRIETFAAEFDPQPFHLDEQAARNTLFGGLAASGWHTAAISMRLLVESELKPAASSTPASMSCAGHDRSGPAMNCASRAKCSRCGRHSRVRNR